MVDIRERAKARARRARVQTELRGEGPLREMAGPFGTTIQARPPSLETQKKMARAAGISMGVATGIMFANPVVGGAIGGAVESGFSRILENELEGQDLDADDIIDVGIGAAIGATGAKLLQFPARLLTQKLGAVRLRGLNDPKVQEAILSFENINVPPPPVGALGTRQGLSLIVAQAPFGGGPVRQSINESLEGLKGLAAQEISRATKIPSLTELAKTNAAFVKKLIKKGGMPRQVEAMMRTGNSRALISLQRSLTNEEREYVSGVLIQRMGLKPSTRATGQGGPLGDWDIRQFLVNWNKTKRNAPNSINFWWNKGQRKEIEAWLKAASVFQDDATRRLIAAAEPASGFGKGIALGAAAGAPGGGGFAASLMGLLSGGNLTSKFLANPQLRKWMVDGTKITSQREWQKHFAKLSTLGAVNPSLRPTVTQYLQTIQSGLEEPAGQQQGQLDQNRP